MTMSAESIKMLECFQGEVAKLILQLPKWYSNTAAKVTLGWSSLHATCTIIDQEATFSTLSDGERRKHHAFAALVDDVEALSLVKECREPEERYKPSFTSQF